MLLVMPAPGATDQTVRVIVSDADMKAVGHGGHVALEGGPYGLAFDLVLVKGPIAPGRVEMSFEAERPISLLAIRDDDVLVLAAGGEVIFDQLDVEVEDAAPIPRMALRYRSDQGAVGAVPLVIRREQ